MRIYIASSWRNQHAVELLTSELRRYEHEVHSFVENNFEENHDGSKPFNVAEWVASDSGRRAFDFDTEGATESQLVIYISPSGCDAWAEVGAAWSRDIMILGLWAKGEQVGLMRRMVSKWFNTWDSLIEEVQRIEHSAFEYPMQREAW